MRAEARNIGIFAHVDAGKTTLSERMLLKSGEIRAAGNVDAGTAHTDRLEVERRRGISVKTACAPFIWRGTAIRLADTPGHADFSSEIERGMWAIDGAVLVISGADGVQPQTEALFQALSQNQIPTLIFVNKMDRDVSNFGEALKQARALLSPRAFNFQNAEEAMAAVAEEDEDALSSYMEGNIWPENRLRAAVSRFTRDARLYPAFRGSALTGEGVDALLDAVVDLLPPPGSDESALLSGIVFAVEPDAAMGRAAYVRLFGGALKSRDTVELSEKVENEYGETAIKQTRKITQIRALGAAGRGADVGEMCAGDIAVVYGLGDVKTGQALGPEEALPARVKPGELRPTLFMAKATPDAPDGLPALKRALEQLSAEDPLLNVTMIAGFPHVKLMGPIQLEVLAEELASRFQLRATFAPPEVVYRETIKQTAVGFVAYTMPKPCWAVIKFEISPAPRGSGVTFESLVTPLEIKPRYQHQVRQAIRIATRQGMLGWQVDDIHIKLIGGGDHEIHTHPLDFIVATPMAFMDGLRRGGSALLEPIMEMELRAEENIAGKLIGAINAMRGCVRTTRAGGGKLTLVCEVPAAECADFPTYFARVTSGRGAMTSRLMGYRECEFTPDKTCPRRGVNPLDTAKYILAARSALDGGIFG